MRSEFLSTTCRRFLTASAGAMGLATSVSSDAIAVEAPAGAGASAPAGDRTAVRPFRSSPRRAFRSRSPSASSPKLYPAPRSWAEKAYPKPIHDNRLPKGGHFAAWEQTAAFTSEMRAAFRTLRSA